MSTGEGAIPVEPDYTQSLVSLKFGSRLRTMCCSDKVCKWNVLGVQGALLSQFMEPLYLSSITIGTSFSAVKSQRKYVVLIKVVNKTFMV